MKGGFSNGMDPQKLSQLDPKLREAYQRVMGVVIPKPQSPTAQAQTPLPDEASAKAGTPIPSISQPEPESIPTPTPTSEPIPAPKIEPVAEPQAPPTVEPEPFLKQPPISESATKPQPAIPQQEATPAPQPTNPTQQSSNFIQMNSEVSAAPTPTQNFTAPVLQAPTVVLKKKGNMLIPAMIAITILVFIVVYGLFWARIFNLNLPFLP
ncbi:MAG: hypothetical protein Q8P29_01880 [Candidatus Levybacteria bacterium]|nr:hypothetical protein [Candidatus Levybacteria bacterium]